MTQLKTAAVRGGLANLLAKGISAIGRIASIIVLARLLDPRDFGLMAMVTSTFSILGIFQDFGLSTATIQRGSISNRELSSLFWINVAVGVFLASVTALASLPASHFYREPRLIALGGAFAITFLLSAAAVQHIALLSRQMRFTTLAVIDSGSLLTGTAAGIGMAWVGFGYWSLLGMMIAELVCRVTAVWLCSGWRPGVPARLSEIRGLLHTGGIVTLNGVVMHLANSLDKILLGRAYGPANLGLYSRAQQVIAYPVDIVNSAVGTVLLSALSRVRGDNGQLKSFFLKSYSMLISVTAPTAVLCGLLASDIVEVLLGAKWLACVPIFRALAPTVLIYGALTPMYSLLIACGLVKRSLWMALVLAPIMIVGYTVGMRWGPVGMAFGLSLSLALWSIPHIAWTLHRTPVRLTDVLVTIGRSLLASGVSAGPVVLLLGWDRLQTQSPLLRLAVCVLLFTLVYAPVLLVGMRQWALFKDVFDTLLARSTTGAPAATDH